MRGQNKGRLDMAIKGRPELKDSPLRSVMDVQDNTKRGDGNTVPKVMTTFQMEARLKDELKQQCSNTGMKIGEAINIAVREWLDAQNK